MKKFIQGFIAGVAVATTFTGFALSSQNSITAVKSRLGKRGDETEEQVDHGGSRGSRIIKVEDESDTSDSTKTVTPEYSSAEEEKTPEMGVNRKRPEVKGYRKQSN